MGRWVEQIEPILHRACDGETYISVCLIVIDMWAVDEGNHVDREKIIEPLGGPSGSLLLQLLAGEGPLSFFKDMVVLDIPGKASGSGVLDHGLVSGGPNYQGMLTSKLGKLLWKVDLHGFDRKKIATLAENLS
jgi:hypothetical protein